MKLSLYSGTQQKDHIDEGLERALSKAGWTQSFAAELTRLAFGFAGVAVALYVWYLEKTVPFRDSRVLVGGLCALYFSFTWGGWLYQRYVEKNATYIGFKDNKKVWIVTSNPRNTDEYKVTVYKQTPSDSGLQVSDITLHIPEIVDSLGTVHEEKLSEVLALVSDGKLKSQ